MQSALAFLRAFAPLREVRVGLLLAWLGMAMSVVAGKTSRAEEDFVKDVAHKAQERFEEIAAGVSGVMGIVVDDLAGDYRFAVNEDREFAQASAIKIPILIEVLKQADEGKIKLADQHWVTSKHQVAGSGILSELGDHSTQMSVEDLATCMIMLSDNTATNMLIDLVGMDNVNDTMKSLGCEHTKLQRRMMDTAASARGEENISTPADAARLLRMLHAGSAVNRQASGRALAILRKPKPGAVNSVVPANVPVAFKPGAVPGVETEWAIVELKGRPFIVVMMGAYDSGGELKTAMRQVAKTAYEFYSRLATATKYGAYIDPAEWAKH
jgi:beta-lactamase class A